MLLSYQDFESIEAIRAKWRHQALGIGLPIKNVDDDDQKPNFKLLGSLKVILMAINSTTCQQGKPQKVLFARKLIVIWVICNVLPLLDRSLEGG